MTRAPLPEASEASSTEAEVRPVPAVSNAVRLLHVLADSDDPLTLSEAARKAGVPVPTALKILRTLAAEGLVQRAATGKSYQLGPTILQLARSVPRLETEALLRSRMHEIATRFDCLTALWHITPTRVILRERALADRPLRLDMPITQRMPVYLGAVGRAVAAARAVPEDKLRAAFDQLRWESPLSYERYADEVGEARRLGYAVDAGMLYRGVHAIASVATDPAGSPVAAISAIALSASMGSERAAALGEALRDACRSTMSNTSGTDSP